MGKKTPKNALPGQEVGEAAESRFPDTDLHLLKEAAGGDWDRFLEGYLRPCWNEVVASCRARAIPLHNADDVFQEFTIRLLSQGRLRKTAADQAMQEDLAEFRGNLPAKYLRSAGRSFQSARFRTYLKGVIRNLVMEAIRTSHKQPQSVELLGNSIEPWIDDSIGSSIDRRGIAEALNQSAEQVRRKCEKAGTKSKRLGFEVLYLSCVHGASIIEIARQLELDRATAAKSLTVGRRQFVQRLSEATGMRDQEELRRILLAWPAELRQAFVTAKKQGAR